LVLNEFSAFSNIGIIFVFSFLLGYAILLWFKSKKLNSFPLFVRLPLYLTLGLVLLTIFLYVAGLVVISPFVFVLIAILSLPPIIFYHLKNKSEIKLGVSLFSLDNILPLVLFILTFLYFCVVISIFQWPPPGDVFNHGLFTSILVYNGKIVFNMAPIAPSIALTPAVTLSGLHVLSAFLSNLTGVFPGEAVFLVGGSIVVLIPMMLYSLTFILTKSKALSLLTFLSPFLIGLGLEEWVFGYFYNGPYPNLFGFLIVLLFVTLFASSRSEDGLISSFKLKIVLALIVLLGLILVYPAFAIYPVVFLSIILLIDLKKNNVLSLSSFSEKLSPKRRVLFVFLLFIALCVILVLYFNTGLFDVVQGIFARLGKVYGRAGYAVYTPIFYSDVIGLAIIGAAVISFVVILKRFEFKLGLFYLIVFVPVVLSLHPDLFPFFSILLPNRSLMICSLLSWPIIAVLLEYLFSSWQPKSISLAFKRRVKNFQIKHGQLVTVSLIILLIFTPSLIRTGTFEPANNYSWLMRHGFSNDRDVLLWINENVSSNDLILNDYSYTSRYLLSFSIKNVTAKYYFNSDYERNRAIAVQEFWKNPNNISQFLDLVMRYNISYVLLTSERGYNNWGGIGGDNKYTNKPFTAADYTTFFSENPLLELVFEKNGAAIYRVNHFFTFENESALKFDGQNDFVRVENEESLMPNKTITISFWIDPLSLPSSDSFVISKRYGNTGYEVAWRWNGKFAFYANSSILIQSNKTLNKVDLGKWWHIAIVRTYYNTSLYINGKLDAVSELEGIIAPNAAPLSLGCRNPDNPFAFVPAHILDDVVIYDRKLSENEILNLFNGIIPNNYVLFMPFTDNQTNVFYGKNGAELKCTINGAEQYEYRILRINDARIRLSS
jgi:hypothetical protein